MLSERQVARLVTGRSAGHLRRATAVLSAALALIVAVLTMMEWQYERVREQFLDNLNVHLIEVSLRLVDGEVRRLDATDIASIEAILGGASIGKSQVAALYWCHSGLQVTGPLPSARPWEVFLFAVPSGAEWLLGESALPDTGALWSGVSGDFDLHVARQWLWLDPSAEDTPPSDALVVMRLHAGLLSSAAPIIPFLPGIPLEDALFVSEEFFSAVVSVMLGPHWDTGSALGSPDLLGVQSLASVFVRVDNLSNVEPAGQRLAASGYQLSYTFQAFDDVVSALEMGGWIGLAVCLLSVFVGCTVCIILLRSYLRLARRDMGILRHSGFDAEAVTRTYDVPLRRVVGIALGVGTGLCVLGGITFLRATPGYAAINVAVIAVLVVAVYGFVRFFSLPKHTQLPVLTLLKLDREFE